MRACDTHEAVDGKRGERVLDTVNALEGATREICEARQGPYKEHRHADRQHVAAGGRCNQAGEYATASPQIGAVSSTCGSCETTKAQSERAKRATYLSVSLMSASIQRSRQPASLDDDDEKNPSSARRLIFSGSSVP